MEELKTTTEELVHRAEKVNSMPHYAVAVLCGAGAAYAYSKKQMNRGLIGALLTLGYVGSAYKIKSGHYRQGYDYGTLASIGLLAATLPMAYRTKDYYSTVMATLGGISLLGNGLRSYQYRMSQYPRSAVRNV